MPSQLRHTHRQRGMSLIVVLLLLSITMALGIGAVQLSLMGEKSSRNERDYQIAWQAAESGLTDAEFDIDAKNAGSSTRTSLFAAENALAFLEGCGTSGTSRGLCLHTEVGKPVWLTVNLSSTDSPAVAFGTFTNRSFDAGDSGIKSRQSPRYIIELIDDTAARGDASIGREKKYVYRITSMGFGPREDIQAVNQSIYRK